MTRNTWLKTFADAGLNMPTRGKCVLINDEQASQLIEHIRKQCAQACYARANAWKDNAARAAKLCGDAITAMGKDTV